MGLVMDMLRSKCLLDIWDCSMSEYGKQGTSWIGYMKLGVNILELELKKGEKLSINLSKSPNCPSFIPWALKFQLWLNMPGERE